MRGGIFPGATPEAEARERIAAEPAMDGADFAGTVTPSEPVGFEGDGPHVVGIDTGTSSASSASCASPAAADAAALHQHAAEEVLAEDPDIVFLGNGPGDPAASTTWSTPFAGVIGRKPVFGICLGQPLLCRAVGLRDLQAALRPPGANQPVKDLETRPDRHHLPEPRLRRRRSRRRAEIEGDEPVRWDTDSASPSSPS